MRRTQKSFCHFARRSAVFPIFGTNFVHTIVIANNKI